MPFDPPERHFKYVAGFRIKSYIKFNTVGGKWSKFEAVWEVDQFLGHFTVPTQAGCG